MKKEHLPYTKKELHLFIDSIDIKLTPAGIQRAELKKEYPNIKVKDVVDELHAGVTFNNLKTKESIVFRLTSIAHSYEGFDELMTKLNLNSKEEHKKGKLVNRQGNNSKYLNQLDMKINNKLPNLSENKKKKLEKDLISLLISKTDSTHLNYVTRENYAVRFNVRLKFIDQIFQKYDRLGIFTKHIGKTNDSWHDNHWHSTFYTINIERLKLETNG